MFNKTKQKRRGGGRKEHWRKNRVVKLKRDQTPREKTKLKMKI